jgi:transposase-like protein
MPGLMTPERTEQAARMHQEGAPVTRIARVLGVGASSVSRALKKGQALGAD